MSEARELAVLEHDVADRRQKDGGGGNVPGVTTELVDMTFTVAERIANWLLEQARSAVDIPQHDRNQHDVLCWAAFKIRTGEWRDGWDQDPATKDPREP